MSRAFPPEQAYEALTAIEALVVTAHEPNSLRIDDTTQVIDQLEVLREHLDEQQAEHARLLAIINTPETESFIAGVSREKEHQLQRWGQAHDRNKEPQNWFWLVGYLAGKALHAAVKGDREKALHHTISAAACLAHWHDALKTGERDPSKPSDTEVAIEAALGAKP